ncbi:hypothetical protein EVA_07793 [gut metagenome]|uniref:Uncharacterized protein n=1 Tax=gut metagenome TaxID=749906 RepID=J9GUJ1_9ZZZZ
MSYQPRKERKERKIRNKEFPCIPCFLLKRKKGTDTIHPIANAYDVNSNSPL